MRDTFALDEDHFVQLIKGLEEIEKIGLARLAAGAKERTPGRAVLRYWRNRIDILECRYSLGAQIDDLRSEFNQLVHEMLAIQVFDASKPADMDRCITLTSWAVLLDDADAAQTIDTFLDGKGWQWNRVGSLLQHFGLRRGPVEPDQLLADFGLFEAREARERGDETEANKILYRFVHQDWFQRTYNSGFRIVTHSSFPNKGHIGYWCYEAAAFAKTHGIDDTRLEGHKYYPWDLAHQ